MATNVIWVTENLSKREFSIEIFVTGRHFFLSLFDGLLTLNLFGGPLYIDNERPSMVGDAVAGCE